MICVHAFFLHMRSRARPVFEQIFQYAFLILGNEWPADLAGKEVFFVAGLTGKEAIAKVKPTYWHWISIACFIVFFFVTVRSSAGSRDQVDTFACSNKHFRASHYYLCNSMRVCIYPRRKN